MAGDSRCWRPARSGRRFGNPARPASREEIRDEIIPFHLATYDQHPGFGTWVADDTGTGQFLGWIHLRPRRSDDEQPAIDGADQGYVEYQLTRAGWEAAGRPRIT